MRKRYKHGLELRHEIVNTVLSPGALALWHLGQSGMLIKDGQSSGIQGAVAFDPYLTHSIEHNAPGTEFIREFDAPLDPEQLKGVSVVLISHHHDDHLDIDTVIRLHRVSPETRFVIPAPHVRLALDAGVNSANVIAARAGEEIQISDMTVLPIAAAHTVYETDSFGNHLYLGYVVRLSGASIYHSGDTVVTDELVSVLLGLRPDIALLPINGNDYARTSRGIIGNMSAREAVDLAAKIDVDLLLPNHYDMFPSNRDNPSHFIDYLFTHHPHQKFHMMAVGERFIYFPTVK